MKEVKWGEIFFGSGRVASYLMGGEVDAGIASFMALMAGLVSLMDLYHAWFAKRVHTRMTNAIKTLWCCDSWTTVTINRVWRNHVYCVDMRGNLVPISVQTNNTPMVIRCRKLLLPKRFPRRANLSCVNKLKIYYRWYNLPEVTKIPSKPTHAQKEKFLNILYLRPLALLRFSNLWTMINTQQV